MKREEGGGNAKEEEGEAVCPGRIEVTLQTCGRRRKDLQTLEGRNAPTDSKGRPRRGHTKEPRSDWVRSGHIDSSSPSQ